MNFMDSLRNTLNEEVSITENGAVGFKTTGKKLLDMNFSITSMRNMNENQIVDKFVKTFYENKLLAVKWLFYVRDAREGVGERRLFRTCMKYLGKEHPEIAKAVIHLIPEYGRWDDCFCLLDSTMKEEIINIIKKQLTEDMNNMATNKPISLLGKWMPSCNTSSNETKRLACILRTGLGVSEKQYRKMLSKLRSYLKVVEKSMSKNEWNEINYATVPSRANLIYNSAFLKHDEQRRRAYLGKLVKGETKINAGVVFPHDIVTKYRGNGTYRNLSLLDIALEEMWKALPDYVQGAGNTICVSDGSGSMTSRISGTNTSCLDVAVALSIYFAERSSGQFKDKFITFSEHPQLVDLSYGKSLKEKLEIAFRYNEVANTNIEKVFDLILTTAVDNKMTQEELPQNILILSDMEFDSCATSGNYRNGRSRRPSAKLFEVFAQRFAEHGYKLPRLVFWNICSRTGTIPVKENDLGVALVSGFSPAIVKMVLSNSTDPFECLLEQLNTERYLPIENAIKDLVA